jgi:hypothetical protein
LCISAKKGAHTGKFFVDRGTKNGNQLNDKNIVFYNKIFEVVLHRESRLTSSPQYTEVYNMEHTLNTLNCEFSGTLSFCKCRFRG